MAKTKKMSHAELLEAMDFLTEDIYCSNTYRIDYNGLKISSSTAWKIWHWIYNNDGSMDILMSRCVFGILDSLVADISIRKK